MLQRLEQLLAGGKDGALLRFSLGNEYLKRNEPAAAAAHLRRAVELDPKYSAAWKMLGRACAAAGQSAAAVEAWSEGIRIAEDNGDQQAAREMTVFLRRLGKSRPTN
jgi:predicted Zn-dependent protease